MRFFSPTSNDNLDLPAENQGNSDFISSISGQLYDVNVSPESVLEQCQNEPASAREAKNAEVQEVKKASEKKSRKQKKKAQSVSDSGKGSSKTISSQKSNKNSRIKETSTSDSSSVVQRVAEELLNGISPLRIGGKMSEASAEEPLVSQQAELSMNISTNKAENIEMKDEQEECEILHLTRKQLQVIGHGRLLQGLAKSLNRDSAGGTTLGMDDNNDF